MFLRLKQFFLSTVEAKQYQVIQLVSVKRSYLERRDKNRFRELVEIPNTIELSPSQVTAATSHAQETLVVAGAGSGKTSVLIRRAKYLVESGRAQEDQILMLAYNKDAAEELSNRAKLSDIHVLAQTFHGFGNSVVKTSGERTGVAFGNQGEVTRFLQKQLDEVKDEEALQTLSEFFSEQLVPKRTYAEFRNLSEYAAYVRSTVPTTLLNERVKSHGEWLIANFLFTNTVEYKYEALYDVAGDPRSRHIPDFTLYLPDGSNVYVEYFGTDRRGSVAPGIDREVYRDGITWKESVHESNGTHLISLYYYDLVEGNLLKKLEDSLRSLNVNMKARSTKEILNQANEVGYQSRFLKVCEQFLTHVRAQRLSGIDLLALAERDRRSLSFLKVFNIFLANYEAELRERKLPDYAELIHGATDAILRGEYEFKFSQLLVDEFQDISMDRFRLIEAMKVANPNLQVTCVGDDWQSIYRFSGSDVSIMRASSKPKMNRKRVDLAETFRLPQEIADLSRSFVLKNPMQLTKIVFSKASSDIRGRVVTHWDTDQREIVENLKRVIGRIGAPSNDPSMSLRILARYSDNLPDAKLVSTLWEGPINISTIHAAKGLEADYVIVMDLIQDFRGFPSTIEDDPIMNLVMPERESQPHAEERRLFYVALSRARRECHLISPLSSPSLFTLELLDSGFGEHIGIDDAHKLNCPVCLSGRIIVNPLGNGSYCSNSPLCSFSPPRCPTCSKPMIINSENLPRYICSTHPEIKLKSCPVCEWGVLVPRRGVNFRTRREETFFSCHTWKNTRCPGKAR